MKRKSSGTAVVQPLGQAGAMPTANVQRLLGLIVALLGLCLYLNSIPNRYVLDDAAAITQNKVVTQGLAGIGKLLQTDYWFGFVDGVRVPQYRPLSLVTFAVEWQFFPNNPHVSHGVNVLLFALSCWVLFHALCILLKPRGMLLPFLCALLWAAHPIHTEVVDNIKSRDELMGCLLGLTALVCFVRAHDDGAKWAWAMGGLCYLLSLLSKETGITFMVLIPLSLYFFRSLEWKKIALTTVILGAASGVYLLARAQVVRNIPAVQHFQLIDNALLAADSYVTQFATATYILLQYLGLLLFPHPLSYDYSYAEVPLQTLGSPGAIVALLVFLGLGGFAVWGMGKKSLYAFCILLFLIAIAPVSNVFILIGSTKAERFLYLPSLAFCLAVAAALAHRKGNEPPIVPTDLRHFVSLHKFALGVACAWAGLYAIKVVTRNADWKDNLSLMSHDVKVADESARAHFNLGSTLIHDKYAAETNAVKKDGIMRQALQELEKAAAILPDYPDVHRELAYLHFQGKDYAQSIVHADVYLRHDPGKAIVHDIKGAALFGQQKYREALACFEKAVAINPADTSAYKNMGRSYGYLGQYDEAIVQFKHFLEFAPRDREARAYIATAYQLKGDSLGAVQYMDPK